MGSNASAQRSPRPAMVSVSVAATERLHVIAHRAVLAARDFDDWWDTPLEAAFATVDLARHTHAHWIDAERALVRVLRWWREDGPRRTSADVTALALAARASAELQQQDPGLVVAAAQAVEDLARRDLSITPALHLAVCAWALDPLVPDRDTTPWPALRARLEHPSQVGADEPLRRYATAIARRLFDSAWLVQELVSQIGGAAGPSDACVLIWLITVACEKISLFLPPEDSALQVLIRRRTELSQRLAGEIDERTFRDPEPSTFEEDDLEIAPPIQIYLTSFEAVLLDFALATRDAGQPWLTYEEAANLFDERAVEARTELAAARHRLLGIVAMLFCSLGVVAGIALWQTLRSSGIERSVANPAAIALVCLFLTMAVGVAARGDIGAQLAEPLGIFFVSLALLASAVAINQTSRRPYISDVGGLVAVILIATIAAVLWALVKRWASSRHR